MHRLRKTRVAVQLRCLHRHINRIETGVRARENQGVQHVVCGDAQERRGLGIEHAEVGTLTHCETAQRLATGRVAATQCRVDVAVRAYGPGAMHLGIAGRIKHAVAQIGIGAPA